MFEWRGRRYDVVDVIGKWRIEGRWWDDGRDREYWRVEARGGAVWDLYFDRGQRPLAHGTALGLTPGADRADARPAFVHLDVRSCFSLKEGAFTPEQLARARRRARHGGGGDDRPRRALRRRPVRAGLQRTRACSPSWAPRSRCGRRRRPGGGAATDAHLVLLATDDTGYANLCRLLTDAHMLGERGDPWVDPRADLRARRRARSRSPGPGRTRDAPRSPGASTPPRGCSIRSARRSVATGCSWASSTGWSPVPTTRSARCCASPSALDVRAVATNPVRYLVPGDAFVADALECMRRIVPVADTNVTRANAEGWLKPAADDARAVRRAARPGRHHARDRRDVHVRPRAGAGSTSPTSRRRRAAAPTPCWPSDAGAASTTAAWRRPRRCANACTTSSR